MSLVRVPPVLREEAGGAREIEAAGSTVRELLEDLAARLPALGTRIYGDGKIRSFVNVYVDGEDVRTRDGLDTPVRDFEHGDPPTGHGRWFPHVPDRRPLPGGGAALRARLAPLTARGLPGPCWSHCPLRPRTPSGASGT